MKKSKKPKIIDTLKYTQELHHTCNNPQICKAHVHPSEKCKECSFYDLKKVQVAVDPIRHDINWGF